jgi:hypothetical protein
MEAVAVLIIFSVYTTVGATVEQSSTKTRLGFTGIALCVNFSKCSSCSGRFVSVTLIVCEAVDELPHESVAVQVLTEYEPAHEP